MCARIAGRLGPRPAAPRGNAAFLLGLTLALAAGGVFAGTPPAASDDTSNELAGAPLALTRELRDVAAAALHPGASDVRRLHALHRALTTPGQLGLTEVSGPTGTAAEAFRTRRANCVGFALLFAALSREAGIPVWFVAFDETGPGLRHGDLRIETAHLAVAFGPAEQPLIFDFARAGSTRVRDARPLTDRQAAAIYYSNVGTERLMRGEVREAIAPLTAATTLAPDWPPAWVHLAVALRRDREAHETGPPTGPPDDPRDAAEALRAARARDER